jgi:1-deoxy-D-xylulose-5-phosphate synthase
VTVPVLERITCPADLAGLEPRELEQLAAELRDLIVRTVSATGGHLASNLGAVELTIALLTVFNRAEDRVVWDVGHQCYPHKILTGRCAAFSTLRQLGGMAGFPRREESCYDAFNTGHSGTSISVAGGLLEAARAAGRDERVVAVIGDGSMTSGLAFEGLNQMGHLKRNLIVVLNDNEMSISPNVGALSSYMSRIMTGHFSTRVREETEKFLKGLPRVGESFLRMAKKAEELLKGTVIPGIIFEELGFKYVGPIPGHQVDDLVKTLRNVSVIPKPILVHVITKKGKGYEPAERDPETFHGVGPFEVATGLPRTSSGPPTYTEVFSEAIVDLAGRDPRIVALTAAMPDGTGLKAFARAYPDRFFDVGIAEQHAVAFAAGMAAGGLKPVVAIYSTFLQRAYDQIVHDVCLTGLPVVFALDRAGIVGEDGPTHQGLFDVSFLRGIPGMTVMAPRDEEELRHMLHTALHLNRPVAIRYPRGRGVGAERTNGYRALPIGLSETLVEGDDVAILALGASVSPSLGAALLLRERGISARVVDARFAKPVDSGMVARAAELKRIVTVEEGVLAGGFGSAVLEVLAGLPGATAAVRRLGVGDVYVEHGRQDLLRARLGLDARGIAAATEAFVRESAGAPVGR